MVHALAVLVHSQMLSLSLLNMSLLRRPCYQCSLPRPWYDITGVILLNIFRCYNQLFF